VRRRLEFNVDAVEFQVNGRFPAGSVHSERILRIVIEVESGLGGGRFLKLIVDFVLIAIQIAPDSWQYSEPIPHATGICVRSNVQYCCLLLSASPETSTIASNAN
jgi:hypothetical protein